MDFFVVPPMHNTKWVRFLKNDSRLNTTMRLHEFGGLVAAVANVSRKPISVRWALNEKSVAIATKDQLTKIARLSQNELIRRGMNQKTLRRIYDLRPVRPSILEKCLNLLEQ